MHEEESAIPPARAEEWGPGYGLWTALLSTLEQRGPDGTTSVVRLVSHLLIIVIALLVIGVSRLELPSWEIAEDAGVTAASRNDTGQTSPPVASRDDRSAFSALVRSAVPVTLIADRPHTTVVTYTVQAGDTLFGIAEKLGITAETLIWANNMEENPDLLRLGQELAVLPVNGVWHTVAQGDTVESIAKKYKAKPEDIVNFEGNGLNPKNPILPAGIKVIVPGGAKPQTARAAASSAPRVLGHFIWPAGGGITQTYWNYHRALDLGAAYGAQVRAADGGYVSSAGWSAVGYGNCVVIDHGNGFMTRYAHLSKIYVARGAAVKQGTVIGLVGSTGNSTGPHLHFEIIYGGVTRNPFNYLP